MVLTLEAWRDLSEPDVVMAEKRPNRHIGVERGVGSVPFTAIILVKLHELSSDASLIPLRERDQLKRIELCEFTELL